MTTQQPDNFFREKLGDYNKPAPNAAWDRIEASLAKPSHKPFAWWKVAASLTLLATVGITLWVNVLTTDVQIANHEEKKNSRVSPEINVAKTETPKEESNTTQTEVKAVQPLPTVKFSPAKPAVKKSNMKKLSAPAQATEQVFASEENLPSQTTDPASAENENVQMPIVAEKKSSSIKFIITAEETDKYLDKTALAEATSKEQKSSTFKKLLKKANDLKSNQDPFGDLREKKNEILALNFKNEKRGQNK